MPRLARVVCAGVPHHVTQRGNRREQVFFTDSDCETYLDWLLEYTTKHAVDVLAYCLMPNHVHLVVVPATDRGLHLALKPLHMQYAQRINRRRGWTGHVWQGRYFSSVLDETYLWAAIGYVERNPVRAGLVDRAEDYPWSSAAARCRPSHDPLLAVSSPWQRMIEGVGDWSAWLAEGDEAERLDRLRRHAEKGLPCGSLSFVESLEKSTGRTLRCRPRGRPRAACTEAA